MNLVLAQINTTVADFDGNLALIRAACDAARARGDHMVVTPELALTGYPPLDLVERPEFTQAALDLVPALLACSRGLVLIVGAALPSTNDADKPALRPAINAALVLDDGQHVATIRKRLLPTYDVFDEDRYFEPGTTATVLDLCGRRVGITICEDIWSDADLGPRRYLADPVADLAAAGADLIINLSASPFEIGKPLRRLELARTIARRHAIPVAYCNLVGGNDALVFDGRSFAVDSAGGVLAWAPAFVAADLRCVLAPVSASGGGDLTVPEGCRCAPGDEARAALVLGIRDYVHKCGFKKAIIGLSGGIDSAVTAALAVQALGADHVSGVAMPGPYSSPGSVTDALALADNLGIRCPIIDICRPYDAMCQVLADEFANHPAPLHDIADQNVQARIRGAVLMGLSNRTGAMLLTTGNKSELAVGYCTLYGDMNGGLAVIGDLPKMLVYDVARSCNQYREIIPQSTIDKVPSAELAPGQKDSDSLPPYPVLDAILEAYVVEQQPVAEIIARGFARDVVQRVIWLVETSEYKRRQAAPVLRVTGKAFGGGRRIPMARAVARP